MSSRPLLPGSVMSVKTRSGLLFDTCVERLFGILSLRTNAQILLAANPVGYPVSRHRVIVHNHDALLHEVVVISFAVMASTCKRLWCHCVDRLRSRAARRSYLRAIIHDAESHSLAAAEFRRQTQAVIRDGQRVSSPELASVTLTCVAWPCLIALWMASCAMR